MSTEVTLPEWPFKSTEPLEHGMEGGIIWALSTAPRHGVNGYVYVPEGHPWLAIKEPMWDLNVDVHGGITFAQGRWFGFDFNHAWDWWPEMEGERFFTRYPDMVERTVGDVREQAISLARQAASFIDNGTHEI